MMHRVTLSRLGDSLPRLPLAALLALVLLAALAGLAAPGAAASPWSAVAPPWDASSPTNDIYAFGAIGLALAGDGHVALTRDGGRTWSVVVPGGSSGAVYTAVAFDTSGRGVVASGGVLLVTADWGAKWMSPSFVGPAPGAAIEDVALRGSEAVAVGDGGLIMSSGNSGATWRAVTSPTTSDITSVAIAGDGTAVAGTGAGEVLVGAAGTSWTLAGAVTGPVSSVAASASPVWGDGQPDLFAANGTAVVGSDDDKTFAAVTGSAVAGAQSWPSLAWVGSPEHSLLMAGAPSAGFLDLLTHAWLPAGIVMNDTAAAASPGGQSVAYLLGTDGTVLRTLSSGREPAKVDLTRKGIVVGASVGLTATVRVGAPGTLVVLSRVPGGQWTTAHTAAWTVADYGRSKSFRFKPKLTHEYLVEFKYGGSRTELAAATVVVAPRVSTRSAHITLRAGSTYRFTGSVTPALPGESVVLFTDRGGSWRPVSSQGAVKLRNGHTWTSRRFGTPKAETYHLRARLSATSRHGEAWSRVVKVTVSKCEEAGGDVSWRDPAIPEACDSSLRSCSSSWRQRASWVRVRSAEPWPTPRTPSRPAQTPAAASPQRRRPGRTGKDQAFTITPDPGHRIADVFVDGVSRGAIPGYTFASVNADHTITASFAINSYTLTYAAGAHGTISGTTPQTVDSGNDGSAVTAVPASGYHFSSWSDGYPTAARTDQNVTADHSVTRLLRDQQLHAHLRGRRPRHDQRHHAADRRLRQRRQPGDGGAGERLPLQQLERRVPDCGAHRPERHRGPQRHRLLRDQQLHAHLRGRRPRHDSGTTPQTVDSGNDGSQVTAVPASGYHFSSWSDGYPTAARTDQNVTADHSVTASFAINSYTLTYAAGAHGTISGTTPQTVDSGNDGSQVTAVPRAATTSAAGATGTRLRRAPTRTSPRTTASPPPSRSTATRSPTRPAPTARSGSSPQTVTWGASGSAVTAVPASGYHFSSWSDGYPTAARTDQNVTADLSVTASFAINSYTLTYAAGAHGTITGSSPQTVTWGASGSAVTAVPASGYHFSSWSDGKTTASRTDANVTANLSVTASFAINSYTLTYAAGAHGTITGSSPQTVTWGASGSAVTAVPASGYHFSSWSDGKTTASRTDANVTANLSVTASFAINSYTLTYAAGAHGTITGSSPQTVTWGASGSAVTAVPASGYHFSSWSDGKTTASRTDANVTANLSVTASFAINSYTLTYAAGAHGTITGSSPQTVTWGASGSAVTAVPASGYHFSSWSDGKTTASRTDANVTANLSVTASFAINSYTLTYAAGAHGTITGSSPQTVTWGASGSAVTAVPASGYHFSSWSDGKTTASRTDANVTANLSVTASFAVRTQTRPSIGASAGVVSYRQSRPAQRCALRLRQSASRGGYRWPVGHGGDRAVRQGAVGQVPDGHDQQRLRFSRRVLRCPYADQTHVLPVPFCRRGELQLRGFAQRRASGRRAA